MEKLNKEVDELINYIKESSDYQKCIKLKKQMDSDEEIKSLVSKIKVMQKKYIKSNYDENIKRELDNLEEILNCIPVYVIYNQSLEKVNEMINYVNDSLNDYFYNLLN